MKRKLALLLTLFCIFFAFSNAQASDLINSYIGVKINDNDGRFNLGAFNPTLWDLLYRWPDDPWSSFTTIKIDGVNYIYASNLSSPANIDGDTNESSGEFNNILVTQTLKIVTGTTTGNPDTLKIQYKVKNLDSVDRQVGIRIMLDTEVNYNDGAPYRIPGYEDAFTTEAEFLPPNVPQFCQAFYNLDDVLHVSQCTLSGGGATMPDRFILVIWPWIYSTEWDYPITPGASFTSDSALGYYWFPTSLAPLQEKTYVTYYGIGGVTGSVDLSVTGPLQLDIINNQWSPNPFTIVAYLQNNSGAPISGESLTLSLCSNLSLAGGENATHALSTIDDGTTVQTSWQVVPTGPGTCTYTVAASVDQSLSAERSIVIPELPPEICTDNDGDGYGENCLAGPDCDDTDPAIHPNASEICENGIDENCDGVDAPCEPICIDNDGDGYGEGCIAGPDCDDNDANVNPGVREVCNNGIDDNCNGLTDDQEGPGICTFAEEIIFTASPSSNKVILKWTAISEMDVLGYNILRAEKGSSAFEQINDDLISGKGSVETTVDYSYEDKDVNNRNEYLYKLVEVQTNGDTKEHGPVTATPRLLHNQ